MQPPEVRLDGAWDIVQYPARHVYILHDYLLGRDAAAGIAGRAVGQYQLLLHGPSARDPDPQGDLST